MEFIQYFIDVFLHLDVKLQEVIQHYGAWTYLILFVIVFCETGLVVTPILPGDSLLFAAGTFAALAGGLNLWVAMLVLAAAAILGDTVNYWIGAKVGPKVFHKENVRFLNKKHLERTHEFFEKYGGKTIVIARFVPIIRTFAPFVAGIGSMNYFWFLTYNVAGGALWVLVAVLSGYFFGNIPIVKENFTLVILAIVVISVMPALVEYLRQRAGGKTPPPSATAEARSDPRIAEQKD